MEGIPVAERVNFALFHQSPPGTRVRLAGKLSGDGGPGSMLQLHSTNGGTIQMPVPPQDDMRELAGSGGFVEVIGSKESDSTLRAISVLPLPGGDIDAQLWEDFVAMAQHPQLRELFKPVEAY